MGAQDVDDITKVYCTVPNLGEEAIYNFIRNDVVSTINDLKEGSSIIFMPGQTPQQIFQYQYDSYRNPDYDEQWFFLIVDTTNAAKDGILLCNLHPYHGFRDAVRQMPDEASMSCAALAVASINWEDMRESEFSNGNPTIPRFALYDNRISRNESSFLRIAEAVDFGVHYVVGDPESNDDEPPPELDNLDGLDRYTAIELKGHLSTDELCKQHQRHAEEKGLDQNRLAVADNKFADEGALIVQVEPRKEFRCKPPVGGELLWWDAIGFMSWDEIEDFASKHSDFEYKWTVDCMSRLLAASTGSENRGSRDVDRADNEPGRNYDGQVQDKDVKQDSEERRFKYYRAKSGTIIASIEGHDVPSTFTRPRQKSDGVDENGEMRDIEDTFVEELPWDYFLKKVSAEEA